RARQRLAIRVYERVATRRELEGDRGEVRRVAVGDGTGTKAVHVRVSGRVCENDEVFVLDGGWKELTVGVELLAQNGRAAEGVTLVEEDPPGADGIHEGPLQLERMDRGHVHQARSARRHVGEARFYRVGRTAVPGSEQVEEAARDGVDAAPARAPPELRVE